MTLFEFPAGRKTGSQGDNLRGCWRIGLGHAQVRRENTQGRCWLTAERALRHVWAVGKASRWRWGKPRNRHFFIALSEAVSPAHTRAVAKISQVYLCRQLETHWQPVSPHWLQPKLTHSLIPWDTCSLRGKNLAKTILLFYVGRGHFKRDFCKHFFPQGW